jgi:sec-independent protein translocase protein TatC
VNSGFFDHLDVLRRRLLVWLVAAVVLSAVSFAFAADLLEFLAAPAARTDAVFIAVRPQERFLTFLRTAVVTGFAASVPVLLGLLTAFAVPGLTPSERRIVIPLTAVAVLFFAAGLAFGYLVVLPFAVRFFAGFQAGGAVPPVEDTWSIAEYVRFASSVTFGSGAAFLVPVFLVLLVAAGVVQRRTLCRGRRYAAVLSLLAGGILTPPDIYTQILVGTVIYLLYEVALLVALLVRRPATE